MSDAQDTVTTVRYVVSFQQPPGGHPHRDCQILEAESDEEVMRVVKARWSRDEVVAVRWDDGRGQQRRVWIRL